MEFGREAVAEHLVKNKIPKLENLKLDLSGAIDGMMDFGITLDKIAKDIRDKKDNVTAMEFTKCIGELLKKNGVVPKMTEYTRNFEADNTFEVRYGVSIDELDFSEHDKRFEDEIELLKKRIEKMEGEKKFLRMRCMDDAIDAFDRGSYGALTIVARRGRLEAENKELKQRIAELEREEGEKLPFDALETANYLINATYERETSSLERAFAKVPDKVNDDRYTVDELEQIAEHLLVYCKHNKECKE